VEEASPARGGGAEGSVTAIAKAREPGLARFPRPNKEKKNVLQFDVSVVIYCKTLQNDRKP